MSLKSAKHPWNTLLIIWNILELSWEPLKHHDTPGIPWNHGNALKHPEALLNLYDIPEIHWNTLKLFRESSWNHCRLLLKSTELPWDPLIIFRNPPQTPYNSFKLYWGPLKHSESYRNVLKLTKSPKEPSLEPRNLPSNFSEALCNPLKSPEILWNALKVLYDLSEALMKTL